MCDHTLKAATWPGSRRLLIAFRLLRCPAEPRGRDSAETTPAGRWTATRPRSYTPPPPAARLSHSVRPSSPSTSIFQRQSQRLGNILSHWKAGLMGQRLRGRLHRFTSAQQEGNCSWDGGDPSSRALIKIHHLVSAARTKRDWCVFELWRLVGNCFFCGQHPVSSSSLRILWVHSPTSHPERTLRLGLCDAGDLSNTPSVDQFCIINTQVAFPSRWYWKYETKLIIINSRLWTAQNWFYEE